MTTSSFDKLSELMKERFTIDNVVPKHRSNFQETITKQLGLVDSHIEGYKNQSRQRDLSVKYHWGHNHDFGSFYLSGRMGNRHISIISDFIDAFGLPFELTDKRILDVGVWTGGTSLLFAAMGAEVTALEEVKKYANTVNYLAKAFGLSNLICRPISVYDLAEPPLQTLRLSRRSVRSFLGSGRKTEAEHDVFDFVHCSGFIYHVTDPILSLRILFNSLKDRGQIFVESAGIKGEGNRPLALAQGPQYLSEKRAEELNRSGWNYFIPTPRTLEIWLCTVGFADVVVGPLDADKRIKAVGTRKRHVDMMRAGLSRPNVR